MTSSRSRSPFFSIVLPTKNRSEVIATAVRSALKQSFRDFELVVVDNDDTTNTQAVISKFKDPRLRFHRTGGLPMWDNWEYGLQKAIGKYILILEDKMVIKPDALKILRDAAHVYAPEVITWTIARNPGLKDTSWVNLEKSVRFEWTNSNELLDSFVLRAEKGWFWHSAPRGLNSCLKSTLRDTIVSKSGRICPPYAPDFTMAYQQLLETDQLLVTSSVLSINFAEDIKHSTGLSVRSGNVDWMKNYFGIGDTKPLTDKMPLRILQPLNAVMNDFWRLDGLLETNYKQSDLDIYKYLLAVWKDIMTSKYSSNADTSRDEQCWRAAIRGLLAKRKERRSLVRNATHFELRAAKKGLREARGLSLKIHRACSYLWLSAKNYLHISILVRLERRIGTILAKLGVSTDLFPTG